MNLIAAVLFAVFFNMTNLHQSLKLNFKPFNCVPCLSVWSAVILLILPIEISYFVASTFGAGVIGGIIYRLLLRL